MRKFWSDWGNEVFSYKFFNLCSFRIAIGLPLQREIGIEIFSRKKSKKFSKKIQSQRDRVWGNPFQVLALDFFMDLGEPISNWGTHSKPNPNGIWGTHSKPSQNRVKNFESLGQSATRKKESRAIYPFNICRLGFFLFADDSCYPR